MRVEIYAHADAHDDVNAATERCLAYCDAQGWPRPHPMVTRPDDPISPDLTGVLMSDRLGVLVVPHVSDLLHAGVDLVRQKTWGRFTVAQAKVGATEQMRDAVRRLVEGGAALCIVDNDLRIERDDAARFAEMLDLFAGTLAEWNAIEKEGRSTRSKDGLKKARERGVRLGRPPMIREGDEPDDSK